MGISAINFVHAQSLEETIEDKIWKLNEAYVDTSQVSAGTLYVYFRSNGEFYSSDNKTDLSYFASSSVSTDDSWAVVPPPPNASAPYGLDINDTDYLYGYGVIYYDQDDLIMEKTDTLSESANNQVFTEELRFIWDP